MVLAMCTGCGPVAGLRHAIRFLCRLRGPSQRIQVQLSADRHGSEHAHSDRRPEVQRAYRFDWHRAAARRRRQQPHDFSKITEHWDRDLRPELGPLKYFDLTVLRGRNDLTGTSQFGAIISMRRKF